MSATLDFGAFSTAEKQALLDAAKSEVTRRMTGRVSSGSSAAQSYSMTQMTFDELVNLVNGLTEELGLNTVNARVRPNFNQSAWPPAFATAGDSDVQTNSYHETTGAGNVIVVASSPNHTELVDLSADVAGTKIVALATSGSYQRTAGDIVRLRFDAPAIAGITVEVRNGSDSGTLLYSYTFDGSETDNFVAELYFDGTNYQRYEQAVPVV